MLLPMASLLPYIKSISLIDLHMSDLNFSLQNIFYPQSYSFEKPELYRYYKNSMLYKVSKAIDIRSIKCSATHLQRAQNLLKRHTGVANPIVFSLRNNRLSQDRTRDTTEVYLAIAEKLSRDFPIVIIPDTSDVDVGVNTSLPVIYEAAIDLLLRAAVYEVATANICGPMGPGILMNLNRNVRYLQASYAISSHFNRDWFKKEGFIEGKNVFSENNPHQQIDFNELTYDIARRFIELI